MNFEINGGGITLQVDFQTQDDKLIIKSESGQLDFEAVLVQPGIYSVLMNNRSFVVSICSKDDQRVNVNGTPLVMELLDAVHLHLRELGWDAMQEIKAGLVSAQIPGLITKIFQSVGDEVVEGDPIFLMEAMKMENEIKAPVSGTIVKISVKTGQTVEKGTDIIEIK
ncbi:MAG: acetyl-CoA carboxylase biotin carboxyl carrier protein subunit [Candidatus Marinimicrobia bacterium]|nr:acetyl-CoA carboxylase biotin carboxyl carrier protein subunit [Candidatus Neomarinimicrobiota bacterium]